MGFSQKHRKSNGGLLLKSSSNRHQPDMVRLTAALISAIHDGADITAITSLIVPRRDLDQLVGLEVCGRLKKLDLSDNRLSSLEGVSLCTNLQWLSVASNQLSSLKGVEELTKLTVLNASRNELSSMNEVTTLKELRALILNDNEIASVCRLDSLVNLNTIVLSRNPIRNVGNFASKLPSLKKLSLSHCQVQIIGQSLQKCVALEELRLAHNQLSSLPQELERNGRLTILDLGTNHLKSWSDVQVLSSLRSLVNLNLRGNPLSVQDGYEEEAVKRLPYLQILDGHPFQDVHRKKNTKRAKNKDAESVAEDKRREDLVVNAGGPQESKVFEKQKIEKQELKDISRDYPFIDLIPFPKMELASKTTEDVEVIKADMKSKKRKDDSGVVSIFNVGKRRPVDSKSSKVDIALANLLEVGSGGPSAWDEPVDLSALNFQTQDSSGMQENKSESKPYSRWALKKKN